MAQFPAELTGQWEIDPTHTRIGFSVKHAMVSTVRGEFGEYSGEISLDADKPENSSAVVVIKTASINTHNEQRDGHLRSNDFLAIEEHPEITFRSTGVQVKGDDEFVLVGDLTIRGVTREVELEVELGGVSKDPWGTQKAGFEARTTINRKDFGVEWNAPLEAGGILVGEKIKLELDVELNKKA